MLVMIGFAATSRAETYAGISVGASFGDLQTLGVGDKETAIAGTFFVGYNHDLDGGMVGIEADVTADDLKLTAAGTMATVTKSPGWTVSLRARAGMTIDKALLYLTAGPAFTQDWDIGVAAGAGIEFDLTKTIKLRGEVRHTTFQNIDIGSIKLDYKDTRATAGIVFKLN